MTMDREAPSQTTPAAKPQILCQLIAEDSKKNVAARNRN
jgi:hypothetical protein